MRRGLTAKTRRQSRPPNRPPSRLPNPPPSRPRRWREGPSLEAAIWAENIPFNETRDYVKKVLSNATYYSALLSGQTPSLKARLGRPIGPRDDAAPPPDKELP